MKNVERRLKKLAKKKKIRKDFDRRRNINSKSNIPSVLVMTKKPIRVQTGIDNNGHTISEITGFRKVFKRVKKIKYVSFELPKSKKNKPAKIKK